MEIAGGFGNNENLLRTQPLDGIVNAWCVAASLRTLLRGLEK